jgi:hypothetical protein
MIRDGEMSWEESIAKEQQLRKQAAELISKADDLRYERVALSAHGNLEQAMFVMKRGTTPHKFQPRNEDDHCDWCGGKLYASVHHN